MGLAVTGSSLGGVIFPAALVAMLQHLSFGWSVRVCGFTILGLMLPASFVIRPRLPSRKTQFFLFEAFKDRQYQMLLCAIFCHFMATFTPVFYLPTFAEQHGVDPQLANYLIVSVC